MAVKKIDDSGDVVRICALKHGELFKTHQDSQDTFALLDGSGVARFPDGDTMCAMNTGNWRLAFFHKQLYVYRSKPN